MQPDEVAQDIQTDPPIGDPSPDHPDWRPLDIVVIGLDDRLAFLSDGSSSIPITHLFDEDGEPTEDPDEAITFVAGRPGFWLAFLVEDFEPVSVQ